MLGAEEALHAPRAEALGLALQGAFGGRSGLLRALGSRTAEQHERADELVVLLLRPGAQELDPRYRSKQWS